MANLQLIKELAEQKKISVRELAEKVGLKENQIHVMCRSNSTKIDTLEKIAHVLDVPVSLFFNEGTVERYESTGSNGIVAKQIDKIDNRKIIATEVGNLEEEIVLPPECPDDTKLLIEKLHVEVEMLKRLLSRAEDQLQEKERFITHLLDKK